MKERANNFVAILKSNPKKSILGLLVLIALGWLIFGSNGKKVEEVTVTRGSVAQEVAVTGKTVSLKDVELGFDRGGRVASVQAAVGAQVVKGQSLAILENADFIADLNKAKANLSEEIVRLEEIRKTSAGTYGDAQVNLSSRIRDSYAKADDAIRNDIDRFFKNPRTPNALLEFSFKDNNTQYKFPIESNLQYKINLERVELEKILIEWEKSVRNLSESKNLDSYVLEAERNLNRIKTFLDDVAFAANLIEVTEFAYEVTINGYKADVSNARTSLGNAITNLIAAKEKVSSSPKVGEGSFLDVLAQEARVQQYHALVDSAQAQVGKTVIRAPFDGLITRQDAKIGETVSAGDALVALIAPGEMEVEANVSEVNVGKITVGNAVKMTFDAYPGKEYLGEIIYIEPAETIVDNVTNYKTRVSVKGDAALLKSGLTVNLHILTAMRDNVLYIPRYALFEENSEQFVTRIKNGKEEKVKVEVGLLGNDGRVEIQGLDEGQVLKAVQK